MDEQAVEQAYHYVTLIIKHLRGELTEDDRKELHQWINRNECNYSMFEDMTNRWIVINGLVDLQTYSPGQGWLRFRQRLG